MIDLETSINQEVGKLKNLGPDSCEARYFRGVNSSSFVGIRQTQGRLLTLAELQTRPDILLVQKTSGTVYGDQYEIGLIWNNPACHAFNYAHSYGAPQFAWKEYREDGLGSVREPDKEFVKSTLAKIEQLPPKDQNIIFDPFPVVLGFGEEVHPFHKHLSSPSANEGECCVFRQIDLAIELTHIYTPRSRLNQLLQILQNILPEIAIERINFISVEAYRKLDGEKQRPPKRDSRIDFHPWGGVTFEKNYQP